MELVVDVGNSRIKTAVFENGSILEQQAFNLEQEQAFIHFFQSFQAGPLIVSSVAGRRPALDQAFAQKKNCLLFSRQLRFPFKNLYKTPETLGHDRLAALAGAWSLAPGKPLLVIDAGTCVTYDYLNGQQEYEGGGISPGLHMRYKALHHFTGSLPLVEHADFEAYTGKSTLECIYSGVQRGLISELNTCVDHYRAAAPGLQVFLCGGDTAFFAKHLKCSIFAEPALVLTGLNYILKHNVE